MGHEDNGLRSLFPDLGEVGVQVFAGLGIHRGEGFVHQQHARIEREGSGDRHSLTHPAGEFVRVAVGELQQSNASEQVIRRRSPLAPGDPPRAEGELEVPSGTEPWEQPPVLKDHSPLQPGTRHTGAVLQDLAAVRTIQSGQQ